MALALPLSKSFTVSTGFRCLAATMHLNSERFPLPTLPVGQRREQVRRSGLVPKLHDGAGS